MTIIGITSFHQPRCPALYFYRAEEVTVFVLSTVSLRQINPEMESSLRILLAQPGTSQRAEQDLKS